MGTMRFWDNVRGGLFRGGTKHDDGEHDQECHAEVGQGVMVKL